MNRRCLFPAIIANGILGLLLSSAGARAERGDLRLSQAAPQPPRTNLSCPNAIDYVDPTHGGRIRQLPGKPDGHTHNIYYHRNPWSANNAHLIGVQTDVQQKNWRVVVYDGEGCFLKELFSISDYDWRLAWDRNSPEVLYTWKPRTLYKYNVTTGKAEVLKSFAPLNLALKPTGPSLNQSGDRILVITSDGTFRSYRLPDMEEERTFRVTYPPNCSSVWREERYIGYRNYVATACHSTDLSTRAILVYDDTGTLIHRIDGIGMGHYDFSPDGQLAYFKMPGGPRGGPKTPLEIRVMNLDGTNDRVLYSVPHSQARYLQNLHLSWPDTVSHWFVASFFPPARNLPSTYDSPLDEIVLITTSGKYRFLARTGTVIPPQEGFWGQPLASPSSDGSRVSFNSNRSGAINQYILWVPTGAVPK